MIVASDDTDVLVCCATTEKEIFFYNFSTECFEKRKVAELNFRSTRSIQNRYHLNPSFSLHTRGVDVIQHRLCTGRVSTHLSTDIKSLIFE